MKSKYQEGSIPSVSICIANYNMEDTIKESLDSVVQSIPDDYEIVIVDESDDCSRDIINGFDTKNQLKKVYVENLGYSRSRNLAVEEASGEIVVTHVDMDDWYDSRYFEPFIELYIKIREAKNGNDFYFSLPNFNITSKEAYLQKYNLRELPMGPGQRDYRWRAIAADEYIEVDIDEKISGRIQFSDRKTIISRARRAFKQLEGLFIIGYTIRRILFEVVLREGDPLYSKIYKSAILPIAFVTSLFKQNVDTPIPEDADTLASEIDRRTYTVSELQDKYDIEQPMKINTLLNSDD